MTRPNGYLWYYDIETGLLFCKHPMSPTINIHHGYGNEIHAYTNYSIEGNYSNFVASCVNQVEYLKESGTI